jgi:prolyl-tRNA synthetase
MKHALRITRAENFPDWYQEVIAAAEMAENSISPGCMVIKPWGYAIWERLQLRLDALIKATGHLNCYFPLFIPLDLIQKEATHVEGFAKEMAVVTHHRVINVDGKLVPDGKLETPLIVRPTSETIIGDAMAKWIQSYRDLPMLLNQWANVVRWELRPRLFLRTREFLWQEGHTAHATEDEALEEMRQMLDCYFQVVNGDMRMPGIRGYKSPDERFAGAEETMTIEAMMQDGRAIQAGTSHYLAQNFAKAAEIQFQDKDGTLKFVHTTSWGISTRLIGGLIMTHADDDGLRLPPIVAPYQIVIVPIYREEADKGAVIEKAQELAQQLRAQSFADEKLRVHVDLKDDTSANKRWGWIKKGAPILIELGPRDIANGKLVYLRRDEFGEQPAPKHEATFEAVAYRDAKTVRDLNSFGELTEFFKKDTGFVIGKWSGDASIPEKIGALGLSVRCLPQEQSGTAGKCLVTGAPATQDAIYAKAY